MYLLKLAVRPWRVATLSQVVSALAVGFLLGLAGFLLWLQDGLKPVLNHLQGEQVITAYLDSSVDPKEEARIVDSIKLSVGAKDRDASHGPANVDVRFVDSRQFVSNLKGQFPELSRELEDLGPEMSVVVPRYVSISGMLSDTEGLMPDGERDPRPVLERIRSVSGIESAESSKDRFKPVVGAFQALRWVARLLAYGLCLALLAGLIHLARMNSYLHGESLSLLRLWGAGEWTLRLPSMLSGLLVGLTGGFAAAAGWLTWGAWLSRHVKALSPMLRDLPVAPPHVALLLVTAGTLIGALSGVIGASFDGGALARYVAKTRPDKIAEARG